MPHANTHPDLDEEIAFEALDAEIFNIRDTKTRLNALQGYFFPRLERVVQTLLESVRDVYDLDPYDRMSFVYRPAHRKDAASVKDTDEVYIGVTPGRSEKPLCVFRPNGTPYKYHPGYLVVAVNSAGALNVSFRPYVYLVDSAFQTRFHTVVSQCWDVLGPVIEISHVAAYSDDLWIPLEKSLMYRTRWESPPLHFPLSESNWLWSIEMPFIAMYPLLDASARLALGEDVELRPLVDRFRAWFEESCTAESDEAELNTEPADDSLNKRTIEVDLDGYRMIRNGLWYQVLARDKFTCCACKRSAKSHGVVLHVDHIVPRSKGGTDDPNNLQALCMKCNTGKSNRDQTRLTSTRANVS